MPEISLKNLVVSYSLPKKKVFKAVDGLNATFKDGEFSIIIGASGCGKSTLLKSLLGLIPYQGEARLDGVNLYDYTIGERNFAYVSQEIVLQPHVTIFDNIAYPLKIRGVDKKTIVEKVFALAKDLNIEQCLSRKPKHISLGQAQRVAIARALIKNASFYFFDEPFSNLDQTNRDEGRKLITETVKKYHASAIYVTHSIKEATAMGDKIFVMDKGKFIFEGTPFELVKSSMPEIASLVKADDYGK